MKMKVRCTGYKTGERYFTIGNIYEWVDGELRSDNGYKYSSLAQGEDPAEWSLNDWYTFEKIVDDDEMSNEEIWGMLANKMEKNGIMPKNYGHSGNFYSEATLHKAVALAYKCGYMRAQKGRPFKYGEKKTKERNFVKDKDGHKIFYEDDGKLEVGTKVVFIDNSAGDDIWPVHGTMGVVKKNSDVTGLFVFWFDGKGTRHNWAEYCKKVVD